MFAELQTGSKSKQGYQT